MAASSKTKKKTGNPKKRTRKAATPAARKAKPGQPGPDDSSESLRAIAKSFAARLLR